MTDVLIIGGGLAGCAAALWLADRGRSATIVEARPRLGGRALSRDWDGSGKPVEYGGGWLRRDHHLIRALARRLGIGLDPRANITRHRWFRDGAPVDAPADDMPAHLAGMDILLSDAALLATDSPEAARLHQMTVADYFTHRALPASVRQEFMAWWAISGSGDPTRIAVTELLTPKLAAGNRDQGLRIKLEELADTVQGGVMGLVDRTAAASGATLRMGDAVERLSDTQTGITTTLASGQILTARTALVAVPINTLNQIRFSLPLSPPQAALRHVGHAGRAVKLLIRARGVTPGQIATGETAGLRWLYADHLLPDGSTLIMAFGLADEMGEPDANTARRALAAAFPEAQMEGCDWHDWLADPYARGTWVSPDLASLPQYDPAHWAMTGRIAYAGSDHASAEQGWFEGALLTAQTAVASLDQFLSRTDQPA